MIADYGTPTVATVELLKLDNMIADYGTPTVATVELLKLDNMIASHGKAASLPLPIFR